MRKLYERLIQVGYSICQVESLNNISLNGMDHIQIIEKGRSVGYYSQLEINYSEIACLVNRMDYQEGYVELLKDRSRKLFTGGAGAVLELESVNYRHIKDFSLKLYQEDIIEINCRTSADYTEIKDIFTGKAGSAAGRFRYGGKEERSVLFHKAFKKREIGFVDFANIDNLLFENLSIVENVCYPLCLKIPNFYMHGKYIKAAEDYIKMIMPDLDICARVRDLTQEQIIRLAFCKWILCKPKILFVFISSAFAKDEPDLLISRMIVELNKYGIPVLIISERYKFESEIIEEEYIVNNGIVIKKE